MNKLIVNSASVSENGNKARLTYSITMIKGNETTNKELYYEVDSSLKNYLCYECADPVLVQNLMFLIRFDCDFESKVPISEDLFFKIKTQFLPSLYISNPGVYEPKLDAPVEVFNWNPKEVAMPMSMGVDSLYAFVKYTSDDVPEGRKVTALTFFENGAHHSGGNGTKEDWEKIFLSQMSAFEEFCDKYGYLKIVVRSNIKSFITEAFDYDSFHLTSTYRNMGTVLALQKLIKFYYSPSGGGIEAFGKVDIKKCPAYYESSLLPVLATNNTSFYKIGGDLTRLDKLKRIVDLEPVQNHLLVCVYDGANNCGNCKKCRRTLFELDVLGKLDKFGKQFDLENYKKHRDETFHVAFTHRFRDEFYEEACKELEKQGYKPPMKTMLAQKYHKIFDKK